MEIGTVTPSSMSFGRRSFAIAPNDGTDLPEVVKAVVTLSAGNLAIVPPDDDGADPVIFTDVPAGFSPPFQVRRVLATGTTCTVRAVTD